MERLHVPVGQRAAHDDGVALHVDAHVLELHCHGRRRGHNRRHRLRMRRGHDRYGRYDGRGRRLDDVHRRLHADGGRRGGRLARRANVRARGELGRDDSGRCVGRRASVDHKGRRLGYERGFGSDNGRHDRRHDGGRWGYRLRRDRGAHLHVAGHGQPDEQQAEADEDRRGEAQANDEALEARRAGPPVGVPGGALAPRRVARPLCLAWVRRRPISGRRRAPSGARARRHAPAAAPRWRNRRGLLALVGQQRGLGHARRGDELRCVWDWPGQGFFTQQRRDVVVQEGQERARRAELVGELTHAGLALIAAVAARLDDDVGETAWEAFDQRAVYRSAVELHRILAGEQAVEQGAEGVHIRAHVNAVGVVALLRGHIAVSAHRHAGARPTALNLFKARDAEVGHTTLTVRREQDVVRLDVPMDDALLVGGLQGIAHLEHHIDRHARGHRAKLALPVDQIAAFNDLHHDEHQRAVLADIVDAHDVRVLQHRHRLGFGLESRSKLRLGRVGWREHLHRAPHAEALVPPAVNRGHPPLAECLHQEVASTTQRSFRQVQGTNSSARTRRTALACEDRLVTLGGVQNTESRGTQMESKGLYRL